MLRSLFIAASLLVSLNAFADSEVVCVNASERNPYNSASKAQEELNKKIKEIEKTKVISVSAPSLSATTDPGSHTIYTHTTMCVTITDKQ